MVAEPVRAGGAGGAKYVAIRRGEVVKVIASGGAIC